MGIEHIGSLALLSSPSNTTALQNISQSVLSPYAANVVTEAKVETKRLNRQALAPHEQIDPKKEMQAAEDDFESQVFYQPQDSEEEEFQDAELYQDMEEPEIRHAMLVQEAWQELFNEEAFEQEEDFVQRAWEEIDQSTFTSLSDGSAI